MRPAPAAPPSPSSSALHPASPAASEAPAPLLVLGALFALYVIWGSTYFGIRVALTGFPPLLLAGVRFLCAGGLLFLVLRLRGLARPTLKQWLSAGAVGVLLVTL